jgi:hypothetical protein
MAVREPTSSKAIELKKQGFGVAAAKDEAAKQTSRRRQVTSLGSGAAIFAVMHNTAVMHNAHLIC